MKKDQDKDKAKEMLDNFVNDRYDERTDAIAKKNLDLSMKLSGLLSMLEAYYTVYHQNQREVVKIANLMVLETATSEAHKAHINRKTKNQYNKLENQAQAFYKFTKRFGKEFNSIFGQTELEDGLVDLMEQFFAENVEIKDNEVTLKLRDHEPEN